MNFLIVVACCFAGLIIGGMSGGDGAVAVGFFFGLASGLVLLRLRAISDRVDALSRELELLRITRRLPPAVDERAREPAPVSAPAAPAVPQSDEAAATLDPQLDALVAPPPPPLPMVERAEPRPPAVRRPAEPDVFAKAINWISRWFSEGNVPVKVGMLVLFAGVAALLKYASDEGWLHLPIELRLAAITLAAIAALAFGWHVRERKRSFALALQGGAIGILLLTVFAAFRVYDLIPAGGAFALMLVLVAGAGVIAVMQDALALAVLGILAGFAAPILLSTGSGDHVTLFSYYALLNLAIFAIAWVRSWRALNLLGFVFTFAIGTAWGVLRYQPGLFSSTEPFLLLYFAIYLAVPILYTRKRDPARRDLVDGTLVFGNPLVAFALHAGLLEGARMPLAYSALGLAAIYVALAAWLMPRERMRVLGESFAVLGIGFATLAVPLALSARATASTFALEGAALVWLGLREGRRLPQLSGLGLQALAAAAFVIASIFSIGGGEANPLANSAFISALLVALAGFASAWLYRRARRARPLDLLLYLWALAWWTGAGLHEIDRFVASTWQLHATLGFSAVSAALAGYAAFRTRASAPAWTAAAGLAFGILIVFAFGASDVRPFAGWGLAAFAAYAVFGFTALSALRDMPDAAPAVAHIGWLWTWTFAIALVLSQLAGDAHLGNGWSAAFLALPVAAAWALTLLWPMALALPLASRFESYRSPLLLSQAIVAGVGFIGLLWHSGDSAPLPFLPLINPVELMQLGLLAGAARRLSDPHAPAPLAQPRVALLAAAAFAFVTAATLRSTHHLGGVPWDAQLWESNLAQTALTMVWSVLGVVGWVFGSRRGQRSLWLAGAILMGVVLVKLLLVDRTHLGNLFGIVSFIAYGLLCTVIGYFAPAPPREPTTGATA
ncbi:MAG: DUF2339 domain-containing protein [Dokdonella sp.]|uniref:DUF2339 domain-containing protein n=1 Tax=Dokdonella sp. TaxID=2291710 RepID=UPI003267956C